MKDTKRVSLAKSSKARLRALAYAATVLAAVPMAANATGPEAAITTAITAAESSILAIVAAAGAVMVAVALAGGLWRAGSKWIKGATGRG